MPEISWFVCDQAAMDAGAYAFQGTDPVAEGFGYKADTLEDLAAQANLPVDEFVETVTVWNGYCENGKDLSFFRPPSTLTPVKTPPFYIMMQRPQMLNTDGGPRAQRQGRDHRHRGQRHSAPLFRRRVRLGVVGPLPGRRQPGRVPAFGRIAARSALANE